MLIPFLAYIKYLIISVGIFFKSFISGIALGERVQLQPIKQLIRFKSQPEPIKYNLPCH